MEVYRPAVSNTPLWNYNQDHRLRCRDHSHEGSYVGTARPTGTNLLIMPVTFTWPHVPLTDQSQSKGLYVSDARSPLYARIVTSAKSWLIILVVKKATSLGALSPPSPVKSTISDQIKFNDKSQSVITCAPLGSVFV